MPFSPPGSPFSLGPYPSARLAPLPSSYTPNPSVISTVTITTLEKVTAIFPLDYDNLLTAPGHDFAPSVLHGTSRASLPNVAPLIQTLQWPPWLSDEVHPPQPCHSCNPSSCQVWIPAFHHLSWSLLKYPSGIKVTVISSESVS